MYWIQEALEGCEFTVVSWDTAVKSPRCPQENITNASGFELLWRRVSGVWSQSLLGAWTADSTINIYVRIQL